MAAILVTGASGFVGGHLTHALVQRGHKVRCSVRTTSRVEQLKELGVELVEGDLLDKEAISDAVAGVDYVFHAAACLSAFRASTMYQVNGSGTANVAVACARQQEPPVLLLVSSAAAAGPTCRGRLRSESERPAPISHYGISKRGAEIAVERFAHRVPTTIVRPGIVYGPGDADSLLPMCQMIDKVGTHFIAGMHSPPLSFIHVLELVDLLINAAMHGKRVNPLDCWQGSAQGYYFGVIPEHPTYFQFGRLLNEALERTRRTRYWHVPSPFPWLVGAASEGIARMRGVPDRFNLDKIREAMAESWACSGAAAERELGFRPHKALTAQLADTVRWYRQEGWL